MTTNKPGQRPLPRGSYEWRLRYREPDSAQFREVCFLRPGALAKAAYTRLQEGFVVEMSRTRKSADLGAPVDLPGGPDVA